MTYRKPKPQPVEMAPCGECPKGKCDRCDFCRNFAKYITPAIAAVRRERAR